MRLSLVFLASDAHPLRTSLESWASERATMCSVSVCCVRSNHSPVYGLKIPPSACTMWASTPAG